MGPRESAPPRLNPSATLKMVFTTHIFVFYFLPVVLLVYYALPLAVNRFGGRADTLSRCRNLWLLTMSYVFYGWWNPWFILLMLCVSVANYGCGRAICRPGATPRQRRFWLTVAVVASLSTLGFFKYFVFLQNNLNLALAWFGNGGVTVLDVLLPVGISFYTFQALSYSVDVYRGDAPPARSLADFACYIALFPQLIAGPIIRYHTVATQLVSRSHTRERFASGAALFVLGFAKKILLANPLGRIADTAFAAESLTAVDAWFGVVAYAFQIYFDFAGYSDMAVGLGRMIGFEFIKNFNAPYRADSITDFWRRWHISLSTFLRDYLYIPLGGNRHGARWTYVNLTIVMLLGGLWHGANWTFVLWGAYHGLWLAFERWLGKQSAYHRLPRPARVGITFVVVLFSWVLFRAETLGEAGRYFGVMFGGGERGWGTVLLSTQLYTRGNLILMALAAWLALMALQAHDWSEHLTWPKAAVVGSAFVLALMVMYAQAFNPFLYFQF
jgi:alginate O-acetyltransferase complex protein AlgI